MIIKSDSSTEQPRKVSRHHVAKQMQELILDGQFKPNSKLLQQDLAARFSVSQAVIREALLSLESLGLVQSIDNRGMFVKALGFDALIDALDIREVHEQLAVRLCCDRVSRSQIRELEALAMAASELAHEDKLQEAGKLDRSFHCRLIELSGNQILQHLQDRYMYLTKIVHMGREPDKTLEDHLAILQAIEKGQIKRAEKLIVDHIRIGKEILIEKHKKGELKLNWLV